MKKVLAFILVTFGLSVNICYAGNDWAGNYIVRSMHISSETSEFNYVDNFEMTIEEVDGDFFITTLMGMDLKLTYDNGFKLDFIDDGIAYVNTKEYSVLRFTDYDNPLYRLIAIDGDDEWLSEWYFVMDGKGEISMGEFKVLVYNYSKNDGYWLSSQYEAWYMDMIAVKDLMLTDWSGKYRVNASVFEYQPSMEYPKNFDIVIENIDGYYYVTSLLGYDIKKPQDFGEYYYAAFRLIDNGDGTATIKAQTHVAIGTVLDNSDREYMLDVWDNVAQKSKETWTLRMNNNGDLIVEDFSIVSYRWDPWLDTYTDSKLEAKYSLMVGRPVEDENGISTVINTQNAFRVIGRSIALDNIANISVYTINGNLYYQGHTDSVNDLPAGMYVVRVGDSVCKVAIK